MFVHAHPDDEALLTGGTMALLAKQGHRVVLVTATDGAAGLVSAAIASGNDVADLRSKELQASCRALGVAQFYPLGFADSGLDGHVDVGDARTRFVDADIDAVARQVVEILAKEQADIFVGYDPTGGYGHPDHIEVYKVCQRASELCDVPLIEATIPREPILRAVKAIYAFRWAVPALKGLDMQMWNRSFTARAEISFRVDVRPVIEAKRKALAAHASQATGDDGPRTLSALLRMPQPMFRKVLGTEWYAAPGRSTWSNERAIPVTAIFPPMPKGRKTR